MERRWAQRRKIIVLSIIGGVLIIIAGIIGVLLFSEEPTCSDGVQNQDERGVDCGGSCSRVCDADAAAPIVLWERIFHVTGNTYSLVALIENQNQNAASERMAYTFRIYDRDNVAVRTVEGSTPIPAGKTFALFEGRIQLPEPPRRTVFSIDEIAPWHRDTSPAPDANLNISRKELLTTETAPELRAVFENTGVTPIRNIEAVSVVYDKDGNAIGVSRTLLEELGDSERSEVVFTWPQPFDAGTTVCTTPANVMVSLDRSGSMNDDNPEPPQPLTDVKNAAATFLDELTNADKAGVVSFATDASTNARLSESLPSVKNTIRGITIGTPDHEQHTNLAAGIRTARRELTSERRSDNATGMIVLLTDGIATRPNPPDGSSATSSEAYAKQVALEAARQTREQGMELFVIGLGEQVEEDYLKRLAGDTVHYSYAPDTAALNEIYQDVATYICKKGPATTRIFTRVRSE